MRNPARIISIGYQISVARPRIGDRRSWNSRSYKEQEGWIKQKGNRNNKERQLEVVSEML